MRSVPLRAVPPADRSSEPGYREWHARTFGRCQVCGVPGLLVRHHVILEQHVRAAGGNPWDLANSLLLGAYCRCHAAHHSAATRLSLSVIPDAAIAFCSELYGEHAGAYLSRHYAP